jgi:diguanylate cyclase (GGDEF)-like protein
MHTLSLVKQSLKDIIPSNIMGDHWSPAVLDDTPETYIRDLARARVSLSEAERIIRAQQEHIRRLEDMALTDELTGLLNRRGFILSLQREMAMARRDAGAGGCLVLVDLDGFKSINDLWGHGTGDDYLQAVAHALLSSVRAGDVVTRIGGDEFAVLFTKMDEEVGRRRLSRLENTFNNRLVQFGDKILPLRASFGLSSYQGSDTPETILEIADRMLYESKADRKTQRSIER